MSALLLDEAADERDQRRRRASLVIGCGPKEIGVDAHRKDAHLVGLRRNATNDLDPRGRAVHRHPRRTRQHATEDRVGAAAKREEIAPVNGDDERPVRRERGDEAPGTRKCAWTRSNGGGIPDPRRTSRRVATSSAPTRHGDRTRARRLARAFGKMLPLQQSVLRALGTEVAEAADLDAGDVLAELGAGVMRREHGHAPGAPPLRRDRTKDGVASCGQRNVLEIMSTPERGAVSVQDAGATMCRARRYHTDARWPWCAGRLTVVAPKG